MDSAAREREQAWATVRAAGERVRASPETVEAKLAAIQAWTEAIQGWYQLAAREMPHAAAAAIVDPGDEEE